MLEESYCREIDPRQAGGRMLNKRLVYLVLLALLAIFASAFEDVEDVLRLDTYGWPYSEIVIHGLGIVVIVAAIFYAFRLGRSKSIQG